LTPRKFEYLVISTVETDSRTAVASSSKTPAPQVFHATNFNEQDIQTPTTDNRGANAPRKPLQQSNKNQVGNKRNRDDPDYPVMAKKSKPAVAVRRNTPRVQPQK
jgi:hypothetical protein